MSNNGLYMPIALFQLQLHSHNNRCLFCKIGTIYPIYGLAIRELLSFYESFLNVNPKHSLHVFQKWYLFPELP